MGPYNPSQLLLPLLSLPVDGLDPLPLAAQITTPLQDPLLCFLALGQTAWLQHREVCYSSHDKQKLQKYGRIALHAPDAHLPLPIPPLPSTTLLSPAWIVECDPRGLFTHQNQTTHHWPVHRDGVFNFPVRNTNGRDCQSHQEWAGSTERICSGHSTSQSQVGTDLKGTAGTNVSHHGDQPCVGAIPSSQGHTRGFLLALPRASQSQAQLPTHALCFFWGRVQRIWAL